MEWKPIDRIEIPNKRRKDDPPEIYEFFGSDIEETFTVLEVGKDGKETNTRILTVPARAVRVFSISAVEKKVVYFDSHSEARTFGRPKVFMRDRQKRAFACDEDAKRAAIRDRREARYITLDLHASVVHHDGVYRRGRGRPPKNKEPGISVPHWRIVYHYHRCRRKYQQR